MLEKRSYTRSTVAALAEKLDQIGGTGPLKAREWRIRTRCGWHAKPKTFVRHLIYGERRPTLEEGRQIEAAHLKYCAKKIEENRRENTELFDAMRQALEAMETSDPEFYRPHIEAVRDLLFQGGHGTGETDDET